jgi:hypothetical protein
MDERVDPLDILEARLGLAEEGGAGPGQLAHGGLGGGPLLQAQLTQDVPGEYKLVYTQNLYILTTSLTRNFTCLPLT